jgi:hypothetical protein
VESQFLVVKDIILKRTKEYNVVALFMKLTTELENHYKEKLLSIADGNFDGHFRRRYMGKGKTKNDAQSYKRPNEKEKEKVLQNVKKFSNYVFQVASLTVSNRR